MRFDRRLETNRAAAISALVRPPAISCRTSRSRGVSSSKPPAAAVTGAGRRRATWSSRRRVTAGESCASPAATARIAAISSATGASFSRKPEAPARSASTMYSSRPKVVRIRTLAAGELAGRLDPVEPRHADVHQDDVGTQAAHQLDRLLAVGRLADHFDPRCRVEHAAEARPGDRLVVGDRAPGSCSCREAHGQAGGDAGSRGARSGRTRARRRRAPPARASRSGRAPEPARPAARVRRRRPRSRARTRRNGRGSRVAGAGVAGDVGERLLTIR